MNSTFLALMVLLGAPEPPAATGPAPSTAPSPDKPPALKDAKSLLLAPLAAAPGAHRQLADSAETALARAMARLTKMSVLRARDVEAKLGEVALQQLSGCDAESCAAEIGQSLGVDLIFQGRLDQAGGLWLLQVSVLQRVEAQVVFRRQLRVRSADALLDSLDPLVREIFGGGVLMLEDPDVAHRLGTNAAGLERLKKTAATTPDTTQAWTNTIIEANKESELLALTEGILLAAGGVGLILLSPLAAGASVLASLTQLRDSPAYLYPQTTNRSGPYNLSYLWIAVQLSLWGLAVVMVVPLLAAAVLGVVDWLDLGRIPVAREGCCRDETALRKANGPGWGRKAAPYVAAVGGVLTGLFTMSNLVLGTAFSIALIPIYNAVTSVRLPGVSLDVRTWSGVYFGMVAVGTLGQLLMLGSAVVTFVGALLLINSEYHAVVDP